ncbi:hypothetical protein A7C91_08335 [Thermococcus piezophilus]|uniref:Uncharacterized protein n=1 Tax=Thermococcus piezophilus TaxID=1712654 RepID=A0A172WI94_9EURY|nr:hypothetical protein A7C91_08335 [Thermococcus piezophilus]
MMTLAFRVSDARDRRPEPQKLLTFSQLAQTFERVTEDFAPEEEAFGAIRRFLKAISEPSNF